MSEEIELCEPVRQKLGLLQELNDIIVGVHNHMIEKMKVPDLDSQDFFHWLQQIVNDNLEIIEDEDED